MTRERGSSVRCLHTCKRPALDMFRRLPMPRRRLRPKAVPSKPGRLARCCASTASCLRRRGGHRELARPRSNRSERAVFRLPAAVFSERQFHAELTLERVERLTRLPEAGGYARRRETCCRALVVLIVVEIDRVEQVEHLPQHLGVGGSSEPDLLRDPHVRLEVPIAAPRVEAQARRPIVVVTEI